MLRPSGRGETAPGRGDATACATHTIAMHLLGQGHRVLVAIVSPLAHLPQSCSGDDVLQFRTKRLAALSFGVAAVIGQDPLSAADCTGGKQALMGAVRGSCPITAATPKLK